MTTKNQKNRRKKWWKEYYKKNLDKFRKYKRLWMRKKRKELRKLGDYDTINGWRIKK